MDGRDPSPLLSTGEVYLEQWVQFWHGPEKDSAKGHLNSQETEASDILGEAERSEIVQLQEKKAHEGFHHCV